MIFLFQTNIPTTYAKNITEEILENIDNEGTNLTSGELFKLIEVFLNITGKLSSPIVQVGEKLADHWPNPLWNCESHINLSLSITKDFVQITSNLYHQVSFQYYHKLL